ncbi:MAG: hypothetical protein ACFFFG_01515 [Candidatus Thorarchaeota archaeon]
MSIRNKSYSLIRDLRAFSYRNYIEYDIDYDNWIAKDKEQTYQLTSFIFSIVLPGLFITIIPTIMIIFLFLPNFLSFSLPLYYGVLVEGSSIYDGIIAMKSLYGVDAFVFIIFYDLIWVITFAYFFCGIFIIAYHHFSLKENEAVISMDSYKKKKQFFNNKIKTAQLAPIWLVLSLWLLVYYLKLHKTLIFDIELLIFFFFPILFDFSLLVVYMKNLLQRKRFRDAINSYYSSKTYPHKPEYVSPPVFVKNDFSIKMPKKTILSLLIAIILRDYQFFIELLSRILS